MPILIGLSIVFTTQTVSSLLFT